MPLYELNPATFKHFFKRGKYIPDNTIIYVKYEKQGTPIKVRLEDMRVYNNDNNLQWFILAKVVDPEDRERLRLLQDDSFDFEWPRDKFYINKPIKSLQNLTSRTLLNTQPELISTHPHPSIRSIQNRVGSKKSKKGKNTKKDKNTKKGKNTNKSKNIKKSNNSKNRK